MKRLIFLMCAVSTLMVAQDAAGQYALSGVNVMYTFVTRASDTLTVSDPYGLGPAIPVATTTGIRDAGPADSVAGTNPSTLPVQQYEYHCQPDRR